MAMQITVPGPLSNVDTTARVPLGTRAEDNFGNEYIYLTGVAATVAGDAVTWNTSTFATTRATNALTGRPIAFAMGATLAAQFGWYLIKGNGVANGLTAIVANTELQLTATAGAVDDTAVAGDTIVNCWSREATVGIGPVNIYCAYPRTIVTTV